MLNVTLIRIRFWVTRQVDYIREKYTFICSSGWEFTIMQSCGSGLIESGSGSTISSESISGYGSRVLMTKI
jgi:hypothetical protein